MNVGRELQPSPGQVPYLCGSLLLSLLIWTICQVFSTPVLEAGFVCAIMMPYNGECWDVAVHVSRKSERIQKKHQRQFRALY